MAVNDWQFYLGSALAFLSAFLVILIDCRQTLRKELIRLPVNLLQSGPVVFLASLCGIVSAACYSFSYSDWMKQVIDLKLQNPIGRGFLVGIAVLSILRSKFFNFKEQGIGGELLYNLGRSWAVEAVWRKWVIIKNCIASDERVTGAFALGNFEDQLDAAVEEGARLASEENKKWIQTQFKNVRTRKPDDHPEPANPKWKFYYKTLLKLALDCVGVEALSGIQGFDRKALQSCTQSRLFSIWRIGILAVFLMTAGLAAYELSRTNWHLTTPATQLKAPTPQTDPTTSIQPKPQPQAVTVKNARPSTGIEQHGQASGAVGGSVNAGSCSNVQIGGNGNTATTNCVPPSRIMSDDLTARFSAALASSHGMLRVVLASSSDDVFPLSQQICRALPTAQWGSACPTSRNSVMGHEAVAQGLECYSDNWQSDQAVAFQAAMKAGHLNCKYVPHTYDFGGVEIGGTGGVTLLIGSPTQQ